MNLNESFAGLLNLNSDLPIIPTIKRRINQEVEDRYQEPFTGHFFLEIDQFDKWIRPLLL